MLNYESIFYPKQHHITIPEVPSRNICFGNTYIHKKIKHQDPTHNIYITKYPDDGLISCIILDFDSEDNPDDALKDAHKLKMFLASKTDKYAKNGINTVIIKSGKKGFHCYIQIKMKAFKGDTVEVLQEPYNELLFKSFVEKLIGIDRGMTYKTLDLTNTNAGLGGNIRLIGSIHPKTGNICSIYEGEFVDMDSPEWDHISKWEHLCYLGAMHHAKSQVSFTEKEIKESKKKAKEYMLTNNCEDPVEANDLRELMPRIYGGKTKSYSDYIMMQCPFHDDNNPSMKVKKEWYYCLGCGEKGNWWNLRLKGVVDFKGDIKVKSKN